MSLAERPAARILLMDPVGRVLLFRFDAADRPPFWATPGGAVDPGESYEEAARRELIEETGIHADPGPELFRRVVEFVTLEGVPVLADERYFLIRTDADGIDTSRHTELERRVMQHWQWFDRDAIAAHHELIYPEDLAEILSGLNGAEP
ncbi:MAG: NUDIX domain-containing protein [Candidatus Sphingomonas phytovorans]|nr:NUDIX domain-containing protein [Sphingomonas sp.]WEJ99430.1 MAG: NUDIX domain-containing protein [Sphingomonas sp.]